MSVVLWKLNFGPFRKSHADKVLSWSLGPYPLSSQASVHGIFAHLRDISGGQCHFSNLQNSQTKVAVIGFWHV